MSEWWTYHLSDFLLFSSRTYHRLFEIYNAAIWPAQVLAVLLGLATLALSRRAAGARARTIAAMLAACWLWIAIAFLAARYATINWAAVYFAWAFGLEAALMVWIGVIRGSLAFEWPGGVAGRIGLGILLFALAVEPCVGLLLRREWRGVEIFGVAPDPTAVATLGILLLTRGRGRGLLMVIPAIWCAVTGLTLMAMKAPDAWIPPLVAALTIALSILQRRGNSAKRTPDGQMVR